MSDTKIVNVHLKSASTLKYQSTSVINGTARDLKLLPAERMLILAKVEENEVETLEKVVCFHVYE